MSFLRNAINVFHLLLDFRACWREDIEYPEQFPTGATKRREQWRSGFRLVPTVSRHQEFIPTEEERSTGRVSIPG